MKRINGNIPNTLSTEALFFDGAATYAGTTKSALRGRVRRGQIPYRRWNGRIIFLKSELDAFLRNLPGVTLDEALERMGDDR